MKVPKKCIGLVVCKSLRNHWSRRCTLQIKSKNVLDNYVKSKITIVNYPHIVNTYSTYQLIFGVDILIFLFLYLVCVQFLKNVTSHIITRIIAYKNFYQLFWFSNK